MSQDQLCLQTQWPSAPGGLGVPKLPSGPSTEGEGGGMLGTSVVGASVPGATLQCCVSGMALDIAA